MHQLARGALEDLLLFGEYERHGQSGRPSTFLAMMLSWISDVPPSMVLPRDRSQSRVRVELVLAEARAFPAEPLRPGEVHHELAAPLVQLGAVELEDRRLGTGRLAGLQAVARPRQREVEAELVQLDLRQAVTHHRIGEPAVLAAGRYCRASAGAASGRRAP